MVRNTQTFTHFTYERSTTTRRISFGSKHKIRCVWSTIAVCSAAILRHHHNHHRCLHSTLHHHRNAIFCGARNADHSIHDYAANISLQLSTHIESFHTTYKHGNAAHVHFHMCAKFLRSHPTARAFSFSLLLSVILRAQHTLGHIAIHFAKQIVIFISLFAFLHILNVLCLQSFYYFYFYLLISSVWKLNCTVCVCVCA